MEAGRKQDLAVAALLGAVGWAAVIAWRVGFGLWGALGTDAALWGLTAMDLRTGAPPLVPPGYPALLGLLARAGLGLVPSGVGVAAAAAGALPGAVWLAARVGGASRGAALLAAGATFSCPDVATWAQQVQPDSLFALGAVALGGLLAAAQGAGRGAGAAAWGAAVLGGLLPLVREHGLPLAALAVLILLATPGRRRAALLLGVVLWLGPLAVGRIPSLWPGQEPWSARGGMALAALHARGPEDVPFARTLPGAQRALYYELIARQDVWGILQFHAARSARMAWDGWALILGALGLGLLCRRRTALALAIPGLAVLPAAIIWSQRRHVLVLVPLALAAWAAAVPQVWVGRLVRGIAALALGLALLGPWTGALARLPSEQRTERPRAEAFADIAGWLRDHAPEGSLLGGVFQDVGLYHPLPRHDPNGTAADWKTFLVADRPPSDAAWQPVYTGAGGMSIYQLSPDLLPRPCAEARPRPDTPYLAAARASAELVGGTPGCVAPAEGIPN